MQRRRGCFHGGCETGTVQLSEDTERKKGERVSFFPPGCLD